MTRAGVCECEEAVSSLEREPMMRVIAILLLAAGALALVYGGFSYQRETHDATLGPLKISVSENRRINVPVWAGVGLMIAGGGLLLTRKQVQ